MNSTIATDVIREAIPLESQAFTDNQLRQIFEARASGRSTELLTLPHADRLDSPTELIKLVVEAVALLLAIYKLVKENRPRHTSAELDEQVVRDVPELAHLDAEVRKKIIEAVLKRSE